MGQEYTRTKRFSPIQYGYAKKNNNNNYINTNSQAYVTLQQLQTRAIRDTKGKIPLASLHSGADSCAPVLWFECRGKAPGISNSSEFRLHPREGKKANNRHLVFFLPFFKKERKKKTGLWFPPFTESVPCYI